MPLEMHKKKGKKCGWRCVEAVSEQLFMFTPITPIIEDFSKIGKFLLFYFVTFEQLSRISFVRYFSAGRSVPLHGADGEAERRKPPVCSAGLGLGGSNFGAVVGVAACRHSGGVDRTQ